MDLKLKNRILRHQLPESNRNFFIPVFFIGLFLFSGCTKAFFPVKHEGTPVRIDQKQTAESEAILQLIGPYKAGMEEEMNQVIAHNMSDLNREKPESTLGNLVADILHEEAEKLTSQKIDFAIQNYGGLRLNQIAAGAVTKGKIFELMPFENYLVIVEVPGLDVKEFFQKMVDYGGWPVSESIRIKAREKNIEELMINGEPVDDNRRYSIAMPDYVADGGDNSWYFVDKPRVNSGALIRDVLVKWIANEGYAGRSIQVELDGRFVIE